MIETTQILQADLLDLLFDGRNKNYGAYEMRKNYQKRMTIAVTLMLICCLLVFLLFSYASKARKNHSEFVFPPSTLVELKKTEPKPEIIPPAQPKPKLPDVKIRQFTKPIITTQEIKPDERPPENDELDKAKIGKVNVEGSDDIGVAPPIGDEGRGVTETPKKPDNDDDGIKLFVEIESEYPGGIEAWKRFLGKSLNYPSSAVENEIEGTVIVQFIVDKTGAVSEVEAVSGPAELREEAVRVIKKSGNWTPAVQNGRKVKSYKRQPITFHLDKG